MNPKIKANFEKIVKTLLVAFVILVGVFSLLLMNTTTAIMLEPYVRKAYPCFVPPGIAVDGAAGAGVVVFEDLNVNGIQEKNEPPIPGVWTAVGYSESGYDENLFVRPYSGVDNSIRPTDEDGKTSVSMFRPGCSCNCSDGFAVMVQIPDGYRSTTPILYNMKNDIQEYKFGFIRNP